MSLCSRGRSDARHHSIRRRGGARVKERLQAVPQLLAVSVPIMRLSARNQLDGVVVRVEHGVVMSTVVVRLAGGQEVVSAVTRESAESLALTEGDAVKAVIKATEVIIGKD